MSSYHLLLCPYHRTQTVHENGDCMTCKREEEAQKKDRILSTALAWTFQNLERRNHEQLKRAS